MALGISPQSNRVRDVSFRLLIIAVVLAAFAAAWSQPASAAKPIEDLLVVATPDGRFTILAATSQGTELGAAHFGDPGDQPLMGDWNCDGVATSGVYRTKTGQLFVGNSVYGGRTDATFYFGNPGDIALAGDFDGDGCDTVAVYRPGSSVFYVRDLLQAGAADRAVGFGNPGDQPFVGDFDGDGRDTFGVYRPNGRVYLSNAMKTSAADTTFVFGNPGDEVLAGDWNGDGIDSVAVYRPSTGRVYFRGTGTSIYVGQNRTAIGAAATASGSPPNVQTPSPTPAPAPAPESWDVDVELWPGDDLQKIVRNSPTGTVFRINGTHIGHSIEPRNDQVFVGASGAVLRGNGTSRAFSSSAANVVIEGLEITGYDSGSQNGAVQGSGSGWIVRSNEIHHNGAVGIKIYKADRATIASNNIHHNGQLGISVAYSADSLVEGNEIAYNNWQVDFSWGFEAGGTKFWTTDGLTVRDNWSHHNHGPGLWSDHDNIRILYEGNLIEDNHANGIYHEIGYDAVIRDNTIRRNGFGHDAWLWGAGVLVAASQNVEIYGNRVTGNYNGITMVQQSRGSGAYGEYVVRNVHVHDNVVVDSGISGAAQDIGSGAIFDANNTFSNNDYVGDSGWEWENRRRSWDSWRSYGHDRDGSYQS